MKTAWIVIIIFLTGTGLRAQKNSFNLVIGYGPSYFFNDPSLHRYLDHIEFAGINYVLNNKSRSVSFNPGINFQYHEYHARVDKGWLMHVNQGLLCLNLDVLMRVSKRSLLRVGLFCNRLLFSSLHVSYTEYNSRATFGYSNNELYHGYSPVTMQYGLTTGLSFPFRLFKRDHKFNIRLTQFVSPLIDSDFHLSRLVVGKDIKVLSEKARPTILTLGFDLNLKRIKKKKTEEDKLPEDQ